MNIALGLLVLTRLGAGDVPKPEPAQLIYRVRVAEMDGLGWRESCYARLQPVARQGNATIWTADRDAIKPLVEFAVAGHAGRVLESPRVIALPEAPAHVTIREVHKLTTQLTRHADGPFNHATAVAYAPEPENVRDGFQVTLSGRKIDQGVLARLVLDDSRIVAVHHVKLTEVIEPKDKLAEASKVTPQLDVPEVVKASVEGEWLIPNNGALVVGLGPHTVIDPSGKANVRERLTIIEAGPAPAQAGKSIIRIGAQMIPTEGFEPPALELPHYPAYAPEKLAERLPPGKYMHDDVQYFPPGADFPWANTQAATERARMQAASPPSHSLPEPIDKDGKPVDLPPLPDDQLTPTSMPGTSEPCASPQAATTPMSSTQNPFIPPPFSGPADRSVQRATICRIPIKGMAIEISITGQAQFRNVGVGRTEPEPTACPLKAEGR